MMGITSSGIDLENSLFNCQKGAVEISTSKVKNKNVAFTLVVETVHDSGSGRLIKDSESRLSLEVVFVMMKPRRSPSSKRYFQGTRIED